MSKMSNIDLKQVIDYLKYITLIIVIVLIAVIVHAERYKHIKKSNRHGRTFNKTRTLYASSTSRYR